MLLVQIRVFREGNRIGKGKRRNPTAAGMNSTGRWVMELHPERFVPVLVEILEPRPILSRIYKRRE